MGYIVENNVLITALEMELEKLRPNVDVLYKTKLKKCRIPPARGTSDADSPWAEIVLDDGREFSTRLLVSSRTNSKKSLPSGLHRPFPPPRITSPCQRTFPRNHHQNVDEQITYCFSLQRLVLTDSTRKFVEILISTVFLTTTDKAVLLQRFAFLR